VCIRSHRVNKELKRDLRLYRWKDSVIRWTTSSSNFQGRSEPDRILNSNWLSVYWRGTRRWKLRSAVTNDSLSVTCRRIWALSKARAQLWPNYVVKWNSCKRIYAKGYGKSKPIASNSARRRQEIEGWVLPCLKDENDTSGFKEPLAISCGFLFVVIAHNSLWRNHPTWVPASLLPSTIRLVLETWQKYLTIFLIQESQTHSWNKEEATRYAETRFTQYVLWATSLSMQGLTSSCLSISEEHGFYKFGRYTRLRDQDLPIACNTNVYAKW